MAKQAQRQAPKQQSRLDILFIGLICLGIGATVGYYLGRQSVRTDLPPAEQTQSPVPNPAAFVQSEASLKSILRSNPEDVKALVQLGNLYYDNSRFKEAIEWYGRALELDPRDVNVRTDRGTSYWSLGQADAAIADFQKSLEVNPTHPQTLYNLGVVYLHGKNNPAEAKKTWERLLAANPDYPERAKLLQQLATLSAPAEAGPSAGSKSRSTEDVEKLLERLKQKQ
jgi:tetratricopeptide (TPR) repeat protein